MRIVVGLSGGVDSSTTLALLKSQGHDLIGITMKTYNPNNPLHDKLANSTSCYGSDKMKDIEICRQMCKDMDIPYYVIDLSTEFESVVIEYFKSEYEQGRTPNPCIICNKKIKFGTLINKIMNLGIKFDYFATGHYARLERVNGKSYIRKAVDVKKDQSYFLGALDNILLNKVMFPLGEYTKEETREIAHKFGLITADKKDSQDFIANGYSNLFNSIPGNIVDENGKILGKHTGIINYTIGQRKGINVGSSVPLFVKKINAPKNEITVTSKDGIYSKKLKMTNYSISLLTTDPVFAKIRQTHVPVHVEIDGGVLHFDTPQMGVTPGQTVILYQNDLVVGHGIIKE